MALNFSHDKKGADPAAFGLRELKSGESLVFSAWELRERPYPWTKTHFEETQAASNKFLLVLDDAEGPAGFAAVQVVGDEAYLENIMVHPSKRRLGHGRRLLEKVVKWSSAAGAKVFVLDADVNNQPAGNLYRSLGFKETSFRSQAYPRGEHAQVWFKDLRLEEF